MDGEAETVAAQARDTTILRTLEKGLRLLSLFDVQHQRWSIRELREATGESKINVLRITKTLEGLGYLARDAESGKLQLGTSIARLSYETLSHSELVRVAAPPMRRLSQAMKETVTLHVEIEPGAIMLLYDANLHFVQPLPPPIGMIVYPGLATAASKIFIAFGPQERWETLLAGPLQSHTERTITDPERLRQQLVSAREEAVAFDFGEWDRELGAVAAPVFGPGGNVGAALSVFSPLERLVPRKLERGAKEVRRIAADLSQEMGAPLDRVALLSNRSG